MCRFFLIVYPIKKSPEHGNSEIGAHVRSNICLRHIFRYPCATCFELPSNLRTIIKISKIYAQRNSCRSRCLFGKRLDPDSYLEKGWIRSIEEEIRIEQKRSYFFLHFSIWHLWTFKGSRVPYMLKNIHI